MQYKYLFPIVLFFAFISTFQTQPNAQATESYSLFLPVIRSAENLPTRIVGNGRADSCTPAALTAAVQLGGRIHFSCGGGQINISLTTPLKATYPLLIDGQNRITLDGQTSHGILHAVNGRSVTLRNMTFINGSSPENGGALQVTGDSEVWINNVTFENNVSYAAETVCEGGGALYFGNNTNVHIYDSVFRANQARVGGAIVSFGKSLNVYNTTFTDNAANQSTRHNMTLEEMLESSTGGLCAGGGAIYFGGDDFVSHNNKFRSNKTNQHGGALFIAAQNGSKIDVWRNVFDGNSARLSSTWSGTGGAIWLGERIPNQWDFDITVRQSAVTRNTAQFQGGGIFSRIPAAFENMTIAENRALNESADVGDWRRGGGGGIRVDLSAMVTLYHVTLANNHAGYSGGGLMGEGIHLQNSLVADNSSDVIFHNCAQTVIDQAGNVQWGDAAECHPNIPNRDTKLSPLVMNGGVSETMALQIGSGAIDIGSLTHCAERDQRNWTRPQGNGCDAGAFEGYATETSPTPTPTVLTSTPATPTPTQTPTPIVTTPPPTVTPTSSATPPTPTVVPGDSIVGDGSAASCTETELASALINGGRITFNCGTQPHVIQLTRRHMLTGNIEVDGGNSEITLDGQNSSALLASAADLTIQLKNMTLANANSAESGAALQLGERTQLTVINVDFQNNISRATTRDCDGGGAIFAAGGSVLTIRNSTFTGNRANNGGAINARRSKLTLEDSRFTTNHTTLGEDENCGGGALYLDGARPSSGDTITIQRSEFVGNTAYNKGGALMLLAYHNEARLIDEVLFEDNAALQAAPNTFTGKGGAVWLDAELPSQFGDTSVVQNSSFINNRAEAQGGGLWTSRPMTMENVTWVGNQAHNPTIMEPNWQRGSGGAFISAGNARVAVFNNTIVSNTAGYNGGGVYGENNMFANTIIANNIALADDMQKQNCSHPVLNLGNNLQHLAEPSLVAASGCGTQIALADPQLSELGDFGGRTPTMILLNNSPAHNGGNNNTCTEIDQRGIARPQDGQCDIGAVEME